MSERLPVSGLAAIRSSRYMEGAWRVQTNPDNFGPRQISKSTRAINILEKKVREVIEKGEVGVDLKIFDRIYMGIYHLGIFIPPELPEGTPRRN